MRSKAKSGRRGLKGVCVQSGASRRPTTKRGSQPLGARQLPTNAFNRRIAETMCLPGLTGRTLQFSFCCFPHASPIWWEVAGKQKMAGDGGHNHLIYLEKPGAGDANRTRDPNLGKVMLYP